MSTGQPVFIIGNPRSGTTLLRLMLTCHPAICIPPEAGFALWLEPQYRDWRKSDPRLPEFLESLFASRKFETWGLDPEELSEDIAIQSPPDYSALVDCIYSHYATRHNPGWRLWGDKNNFYLAYIARIHKLFPGARFVHIVRDPRDVACSYIDLNKVDHSSDYRPRLPDDINEIANEWQRNILEVERSFDGLEGDLTHCLRFEDLVVDPVATLTTLCGFLGEPFDPLMLNYHQRNIANKLEPQDFLSWKRWILSPPESSRVGRFRSGLPSKSAELIVSLTAPVFSRYYGDQAWTGE